MFVRRDNRQPLAQRRRDQQPVEGVSVVKRQRLHYRNVRALDGQHKKAMKIASFAARESFGELPASQSTAWVSSKIFITYTP